ncbi:hypothetical protein CMV_026264 [Castanea mollissima]|uniref:Uncharacterized protein n=1 Tax=Castanea mollissima TaxID=60419 RepID=A0A8J4QC43_9ROSI|nr:hypothetical protein CMV_026264 [Castanea mollissima]
MVTTLHIVECPSIVSLPEEGLPTNLKELSLGGMTICKQVFEWGLHRLTSLTDLTICGNGFEDWLSFPKEEDAKMMLPLPTSLTVLSISKFPDIVFLSSKVFQNLSALERLRGYLLNSKKFLKFGDYICCCFRNKHTLFLPVLQQKLTSQLLKIPFKLQNFEDDF